MLAATRQVRPTELIMRYATVAAAAALTLLTVATELKGQAPAEPINPRSLQLLTRGRQAMAAGNLDAATDDLESAAAIDPRNAGAFVTLGDIARRRNLPGAAIRWYREALSLDGNDVAALSGQGEALVARGAVDRARANLQRVRTACGQAACPAAATLDQAIAHGAPAAGAATSAIVTVIPPPPPTPAPVATPTPTP